MMSENDYLIIENEYRIESKISILNVRMQEACAFARAFFAEWITIKWEVGK